MSSVACTFQHSRKSAVLKCGASPSCRRRYWSSSISHACAHWYDKMACEAASQACYPPLQPCSWPLEGRAGLSAVSAPNNVPPPLTSLLSVIKTQMTQFAIEVMGRSLPSKKMSIFWILIFLFMDASTKSPFSSERCFRFTLCAFKVFQNDRRRCFFQHLSCSRSEQGALPAAFDHLGSSTKDQKSN